MLLPVSSLPVSVRQFSSSCARRSRYTSGSGGTSANAVGGPSTPALCVLRRGGIGGGAGWRTSNFITTCESLRLRTQSRRVMAVTGTESISNTSSPSCNEPQEQRARDAGLSGAQDWMKRRRTFSLVLVPPSNFSPKPRRSPGSRYTSTSSAPSGASHPTLRTVTNSSTLAPSTATTVTKSRVTSITQQDSSAEQETVLFLLWHQTEKDVLNRRLVSGHDTGKLTALVPFYTLFRKQSIAKAKILFAPRNECVIGTKVYFFFRLSWRGLIKIQCSGFWHTVRLRGDTEQPVASIARVAPEIYLDLQLSFHLLELSRTST